MGLIKSHSDVRALKEAGRITQAVLDSLGDLCLPGASTVELELTANRLLAANRSTAPFKNYEGFNHAICVSINEEIVNGPPSRERILQSGDLVSIATAAEHRGIHAKAARTFYIGDQPPEDVARLLQGAASVIPNAVSIAPNCDTLNALLAVVPETARQFGLTVIAELGGAGIGKKLHDAPPIPNDPAALETVVPLTPGLCFTLMPMFSLGADSSSETHEDGWTLLTGDRALSAHFADTLLVGPNGLEVITA